LQQRVDVGQLGDATLIDRKLGAGFLVRPTGVQLVYGSQLLPDRSPDGVLFGRVFDARDGRPQLVLQGDARNFVAAGPVDRVAKSRMVRVEPDQVFGAGHWLWRRACQVSYLLDKVCQLRGAESSPDWAGAGAREGVHEAVMGARQTLPTDWIFENSVR
jgi:hypothetical protein